MRDIEQRQSLFLVMGNIFHDARIYLDDQFKKYDLARNEWLMIAILRFYPNGVSQAFAKTYIGVENSYFTKILNKLEDRDFIIREIDRNDRRNRIIKCNPKKIKTIRKIFDTIYNLNAEIMADVSDGKMNSMFQSLLSIGDRLENYIKK